MKYFLAIISFLILCTAAVSAQQTQPISINGDSLAVSTLNNESIREVIGHVILRQGNVVITCNRAVQFLSRNNALLEGNVVVRQDSLTIEAPRGNYYGNQRVAECSTGVRLNDGKVILKARNGNYYFKEQRAFFSENVRLYDTVSTLTCDRLDYFKNENRAVAVGNVMIEDSVNTIRSDSMVHFRSTRITFAEKNVSISNFRNNLSITGNHLENYGERKYTLVTENPVLVQIDNSNREKPDTLIISSLKMESYNDSTLKFVATDSVKIVQGIFSSKNDYSIYYREDGKLITSKTAESTMPPVLWYGDTQLTGDSINIFMKKNRLDFIHVMNNGFILSQNQSYRQRFDQISGDTLKIYFDSLGINHTDVEGNVLSIYYMYENGAANGLTKSSARRARILFREKAVSEVKMYSSVVSEYYPENLVVKNELSFTLPSFRIQTGRPAKEAILSASGPM